MTLVLPPPWGADGGILGVLPGGAEQMEGPRRPAHRHRGRFRKRTCPPDLACQQQERSSQTSAPARVPCSESSASFSGADPCWHQTRSPQSSLGSVGFCSITSPSNRGDRRPLCFHRKHILKSVPSGHERGPWTWTWTQVTVVASCYKSWRSVCEPGGDRGWNFGSDTCERGHSRPCPEPQFPH